MDGYWNDLAIEEITALGNALHALPGYSDVRVHLDRGGHMINFLTDGGEGVIIGRDPSGQHEGWIMCTYASLDSFFDGDAPAHVAQLDDDPEWAALAFTIAEHVETRGVLLAHADGEIIPDADMIILDGERVPRDA